MKAIFSPTRIALYPTYKVITLNPSPTMHRNANNDLFNHVLNAELTLDISTIYNDNDNDYFQFGKEYYIDIVNITEANK